MSQRDRRSPAPLLSVGEVAILLGQSRSSLYRAIERGDLPLPSFTINGRRRIPRRAVERLLDGEIDVDLQARPKQCHPRPASNVQASG